jgi:hypothetical protein
MTKTTLFGFVLAALVLITTDAALAQCSTSGSCHAGPQSLASGGFGCGFCLQCPFSNGFCHLTVEGSAQATLGLYDVQFGNPRFSGSCLVVGTGCSTVVTGSFIFPGEPVPIGCSISVGVGVDASVDCSASLQ